jgi:hypothetical protein
MKGAIYSILFILSGLIVSSQELKKLKLTKADNVKGVFAKYEYISDDGYNGKTLILFKNRNYHYTRGGHDGGGGVNEGKWNQTGDVLELKSAILTNNVPIKLSFSDTVQLLPNFRIGVVKNLKGEEMPDGLVALNTDSVLCAPSVALCNQNLISIDSIKVVFENGFSSQWIKVDKSEYKKLTPIVQSSVLISSYVDLAHKKYRVSKLGITPIDK